MMYPFYDHMFTFWGGFGFLLVVIFWIAVFLLIVWVIRAGLGGGRDKKNSADKALEILKDRYAKGEIDKKEYEEKLKTLRD